MATHSKKKTAKKSPHAKPARKPSKQKSKKSSNNRLRIVKEQTYGTKLSTKGITPMTENAPATAPTSTVEALLADIAAKLTELVQIETYLANKVAQTPAAPAPVVAAPAVAAAPAPAQAAAPTADKPPTRPGAGTIGGLVWDYCDGLAKQLGKAPTKEELLAAIKQYSPTFNGQPINELTVATQYSKWRSAAGLPRLPRGFAKAATPAAAAPAPTPAPVVQPAPVVVPAPVVAAPAPLPAPIPAAAVASVIAPTATPAATLPPWLRQ